MLSLNSALTLLINFAHLFSKYVFLCFHLTISGFNRCNHFKPRGCIKILKVVLLVASVSASVWGWLALIAKIWSAERWTAPLDNFRRILPVERWMPLRSTGRSCWCECSTYSLYTGLPLCTGVEDTAWGVQSRTGTGFCSREGRCPAQMQMEPSRSQWAVCFTPAPQRLSRFSALRRIFGAFHSFLRGKGCRWQLSRRMVTELCWEHLWWPLSWFTPGISMSMSSTTLGSFASQLFLPFLCPYI